MSKGSSKVACPRCRHLFSVVIDCFGPARLRECACCGQRFETEETFKRLTSGSKLHRQGRSGVYFIRCGEFIKIGRASDIDYRFAALQGSVPFELVLVGIISTPPTESDVAEREHHRRFKRFRVRGEWFREEGELADFCHSLGADK